MFKSKWKTMQTLTLVAAMMIMFDSQPPGTSLGGASNFSPLMASPLGLAQAKRRLGKKKRRFNME